MLTFMLVINKISGIPSIWVMLINEEKKRTKVQLEFISSVPPLFEDFLCFFQRNCPKVHILYDKIFAQVYEQIP